MSEPDEIRPPNEQEESLIQAIRDLTGREPVLLQHGITYEYRDRDGSFRSRTQESRGTRPERIVAIRYALIDARQEHQPDFTKEK